MGNRNETGRISPPVREYTAALQREENRVLEGNDIVPRIFASLSPVGKAIPDLGTNSDGHFHALAEIDPTTSLKAQ
jgi:hypothetical protein